MSIPITPSHVAVLVPSVRQASEYLRRFGFQIGQEEEFKSEGTREVYVERDKLNSLLLIEPILPGPYQGAFISEALAFNILRFASWISNLPWRRSPERAGCFTR